MTIDVAAGRGRAVERRHRRRETLAEIARRQDGVVSVHQAYRSGLTRYEVEADVVARRWRRVGHQCLALHTGPLGQGALEWLAVLDAGPRACLDGASSLVRAGLNELRRGADQGLGPAGCARAALGVVRHAADAPPEERGPRGRRHPTHP